MDERWVMGYKFKDSKVVIVIECSITEWDPKSALITCRGWCYGENPVDCFTNIDIVKWKIR